MAKKIEKTNAARLLDKAKIAYELVPYEFDENDLAAQHVAESLGQDIARVFKTLVLHGDRSGHIVCVVPGDMEVDLKALAKVSGNKKVEMIAMKAGRVETPGATRRIGLTDGCLGGARTAIRFQGRLVGPLFSMAAIVGWREPVLAATHHIRSAM